VWHWRHRAQGSASGIAIAQKTAALVRTRSTQVTGKLFAESTGALGHFFSNDLAA
jgi:hypothetical protein